MGARDANDSQNLINGHNLIVITGFHHTGIDVKDLPAMVRFYTEELGLDTLLEIETNAGHEGDHTGVPGAVRTLVFVGFEGGHQIELVHYHEPAASEGHLDKHQLGASHVCFLVDDLTKTHAELSARGVEFVTEPKFKEVDGKRIGVIYLRDPEGNWLEFIEGF